MKNLIQTEKYSIVYGTFRGQPNQELFRCPRELDNIDLRRYVNENRCLLGWEADETTDLHKHQGYLGYYRLYFRDNNWYGRWIEVVENDKLDRVSCHGVDEIIDWLREKFPKGCNWDMRAWLEKYPTWGSENRYLLKPLLSEHYKVMFDTTYWNEDYPVRIYVYE